MTEMFIPKKIKVGFQERSDTFTKKLSYIIYYDEKGKIRKEGSWKSWCDSKIPSVEFDNTPQAGFILNKGVQRDRYWGSGRHVIRVYDSRDFEFEVTVENLMGILMHSDVSKRDIVEECVFAWKGSELVLLPVNSEEYLESVKYTEKQAQKMSAKDFVEGYSYAAKKSRETFIYMGYREWFDWVGEEGQRYGYGKIHKNKGKKHIFYDGTSFVCKTAADFSSVAEESVHCDFAKLVDKFFKTHNSQSVVDAITKEAKKGSYSYGSVYLIEDEKLITISVHQDYHSKKFSVEKSTIHEIIKDEPFTLHYDENTQEHSSYNYYNRNQKKAPNKFEVACDNCKNEKEVYKKLFEEFKIGALHYVLKNGTQIKTDYY